ncbi:serine/threonine-protein kinase pim-1-like [Catharus ustulatus]|uniref:serine/threonine-protein kinase pim-1-like n=1 Tax=Catharus ustulatus TaxID=91951 RepID=UPI00140898DC|nr:serine/threonine-protein kinase pim-1-like [Catharus ustulatus]
MPRPARRPWGSRPPARPCRARRCAAPAGLSPSRLWHLLKSLWESSSLWWWWWWSSTSSWLRLTRPRPRPRARPLPWLPPQQPRSRPAPAPSPAASPVRAPPPVSSAAGPEPPEPGAAQEAAAPGAGGCPGQNGESAVPAARAEKPPLEQLYRLGPLLGSGGCGRVYAGTRLADGAPVAIKAVPRDRIWEWARLHDGALVPLELVLLSMVSCPGFRGVVQLLDWFELPDGFALIMERPERCRDLWHLLHAGEFLPEPVARGVFRQVLQALRHCTSRGVLHRDIKAENILVDLATGDAKLIDFGCGTILQDTLYTHMAGTREYFPPEWILFGRYHGQPATIWTLGILLYQLVCRHLPFKTREDIVRGQLFFPPRVSQECQHLIRWCLCMDPADRPCLEDLLEHPWLQQPHLAHETAEIHPSAQ